MRGQYLNRDLKKDFNRSVTLLKSKYFLIILFKTVNFLFPLMQILAMCSSNFNSLSIVIPSTEYPSSFSRTNSKLELQT